MQWKDTVAQRPLFPQWPAWQQLPVEVRQRIEQLLVNICLEMIQSDNDREQFNERSNGEDSSS